MDSKKIKTILDIGETIAVEFKRCGNGIESEKYGKSTGKVREKYMKS